MLKYFIRRLLLAVPTLFVISVAVFGLSKCAPNDPALEQEEGASGSFRQQEASTRLKAQMLGLDKPVFYFTLTTASFPDTVYRIFPLVRRERLMNLCAQTGNWAAVSRYETALFEIWDFAGQLPDTMAEAGAFRVAISDLMNCDRLDLLDGMAAASSRAATAMRNARASMLTDSLSARVRSLFSGMRPEKMNRPAFHWHGLDNQYHHWLAGFFTGDLGVSWLSQKPVWESLKFSLFSTLIVNGLAIFLAYLLAVPLGVAMARRRDTVSDKIAHWGLLFLFAMPVFWMGSLLILLFATPDFGLFLINGIALGSWQSSGGTYGQWVLQNFEKFILPILTLCLHILAVLALQMRGGVLECIGQDYIRTARAKGVSEKSVYWRHAFRNALFPIISVFASLFPAIFAGSLAVEYLFQFPGLGMKTQDAFMRGDFPVLFAILMFAATLSVAGNVIADLLYAWADPRVRFSKD